MRGKGPDMLDAQLSQRPTDLGRTVAVDIAGPGGAEILRAAVVSYRHFFNQFLFETLNLCYLVFGHRKKAAPRRGGGKAEAWREGTRTGKRLRPVSTQPETRVVRASEKFYFFRS
jgi:hypothetical protein